MKLGVQIGIIASLAGASAASAAQDPNDRLTLDDFLEWEEVLNPQISPDGQRIVYTRRSVDKMNDEWRSPLWMVNADGTRHRFLTDGSGAVWSPDGSKIAYVAQGEPSGGQIFVRWMDAEGATSQITHTEHAPGQLQWSPDGDRIAFVMTVPKREPWQLDMPAPPEQR